MAFLISLIVLISCFKRPMFGLALLLQTNIIRSLASLNFTNPCFTCTNDPDLILGAITPFLAFIIIFIRLDLLKTVKYKIDLFDGFFVVVISSLFITSIYAPNFLESALYSLKFLILGFGYYFVSKVVIMNLDNPEEKIKSFLIYSLWLAILFGLFGGVFYILKGEDAFRLTIPGVHPIPFSQLLGLGVFSSFLIFISNGQFFNINSRRVLIANKVILPVLVLLLFGTNTRGVIFSTVVAVFIYVVISGVRINKKVLYISGTLMLVALIVAIEFIDFEVLFQRLLAKQTSKSLDDRLIAYKDSLTIFMNHPFGIGPGAFKYYSILPYPHNFFLENISQYGIFGIVMIMYFVLMSLFTFLISLKHRKTNLIYTVLFVLFFYFFIETMFSFTLWMHRGMYLSLGLFAGYHYHNLKKRAL